jgi:hypothetical protein
MDKLSGELKQEIFIFLLPDKYCIIKDIINCMLVCKEWYYLINSVYLNKIYFSFVSNIYIYNKSVIDYEFSYNIQCYKNIYLKYNKFFINFMSFNFIKHLPVCYFKSSRCIDNMCNYKCYCNNHGLHQFESGSIMRGIDDKDRHYILFLYKNLTTNEIIYEFLYHKKINPRTTIISYSGVYNKTYIGLKSEMSNLLDYLFYYKELSLSSYSYLSRLLSYNPCGIIKYNPETDLFYESFDELITIL